MTEAFAQKPSVYRPPHAPATAADVMRPALPTIERRDHVAAAAYLMKHAGVTALVIVDDDQAKQPIAIITEADIAQAVADGKDVNDVRIQALITTHPTVDIADVCAALLDPPQDDLPASRDRHTPGTTRIRQDPPNFRARTAIRLMNTLWTLRGRRRRLTNAPV